MCVSLKGSINGLFKYLFRSEGGTSRSRFAEQELKREREIGRITTSVHTETQVSLNGTKIGKGR